MRILPKLLLLGLSLWLFGCNNQQKEYDSRAVQKLDNLVQTIGDLHSCSYTLHVLKSKKDESGEFETISNEHDVYMRGPDKMYIYSNGALGRIAYWYDGDSLSYFSFDNNKYKSYKAPGNILSTIDTIHQIYHVDFPAADFFYPTLTDDILNYYDELTYLGETEDEGINTVLIEASNQDEILSIWIESETNLPHRLVIESKSGENYDALFSNWRLNPEFNDQMFLFSPPEGSIKAE